MPPSHLSSLWFPLLIILPIPIARAAPCVTNAGVDPSCGGDSSTKWGIIAGVIIGILLLIVLVATTWAILKKRKDDKYTKPHGHGHRSCRICGGEIGCKVENCTHKCSCPHSSAECDCAPVKKSHMKTLEKLPQMGHVAFPERAYGPPYYGLYQPHAPPPPQGPPPPPAVLLPAPARLYQATNAPAAAAH